MPNFTVKQNEISLYNFVCEVCFSMPYGRFARHLKQKNIKVNGVHPKMPCTLQKGDEVALYFSVETPILNTVYNDEHLIVVNKPRGMPSNGEHHVTAEKCVTTAHPHARLCHRLDTGTSGLLMFAQSDAAYDYILNRQTDGGYRKVYLAVVSGRPASAAELIHYAKKDAKNAVVSVFDKPRDGAKQCVLRYKLLQQSNALSLLEVHLLTGRTHQIRAQLSAVGLPILGDDKYGDRSLNRHHRQRMPALSAHTLSFKNDADFPFCGRTICCEVEPYMLSLTDSRSG